MLVAERTAENLNLNVTWQQNIDFKLNVELEMERCAAKSPLLEPRGCQLQRMS
jgi:hypothetical protein